MNLSNKLLSDIVHYRTYAKYLQFQQRRELFEESVNRTMTMHLERFPKLSRDIVKAFQKVHELKVLPSMRSMQFAGEAINRNNVRLFNCSFCHVSEPRIFSEILFVLLSGCGAGYSVQKRHVGLLPVIRKPCEEGRFVVHDSIAGWAEALDKLCTAYFYGSIRPVFDFSQVRVKGAYLTITGAKAPGPEPLKHMLEEFERRLISAMGRMLRPIEVHDLICIASDCVIAGGIRRSALIALFDRDDNEMLTCKSGEWWVKHPYRARANNSAVLPRQDVTEAEFTEIFKRCRESGAGEPGFLWSSNPDWGFNPCAEISLQNKQFCNLTIVNQTDIQNKSDFLSRIYSATLIGTLQAAYTSFPYLSEGWKLITDKEALLGVSFTGIADSPGMVSRAWLQEGAKLALEVNEKYAKLIGVNLAARVTTVKPEGTSSCILGSSSGIHARHSRYYLRRMRVNADDALAHYLKQTIPELVEPDVMAPNTLVVTIPQESPEGAIIREYESAEELFQRALFYNQNWIKVGHREGINRHNVSCTISVKEDEWDNLSAKLWTTREKYSGISLLPFDLGVYQQPPFEDCSKEKFDKVSAMVRVIDLRQVIETEDNTKRLEQAACAGGICEIV